MRRTAASRCTMSSIPGRWTLTTTRSPVLSTARWVWPIDAAASGSKSKDANSSSTVAPSSDSMTSRTSSAGTGRAEDWSTASSVVSTSGSRSVRVDAIWPNFTNMPPQSSSVSRSRRANSGVAIFAAEVYRKPGEPTLAGVAEDLTRATEGRELALDASRSDGGSARTAGASGTFGFSRMSRPRPTNIDTRRPTKKVEDEDVVQLAGAADVLVLDDRGDGDADDPADEARR